MNSGNTVGQSRSVKSSKQRFCNKLFIALNWISKIDTDLNQWVLVSRGIVSSSTNAFPYCIHCTKLHLDSCICYKHVFDKRSTVGLNANFSDAAELPTTAEKSIHRNFISNFSIFSLSRWTEFRRNAPSPVLGGKLRVVLNSTIHTFSPDEYPSWNKY